MATSGPLHIALSAAALLAVVIVVSCTGDLEQASVPEVLRSYGLPGGLMPATVKSHSMAENGKFEVQLTSTCTTKFGSNDVYYKKTITGEMSYGKISKLSGVQAKEFFWVSIDGIEVDTKDPSILWFKVGFISKAMDINLFQAAPACNSLGEGEQEITGGAEDVMTFSEWLSKALDGALEVNAPHVLESATVVARKMLQ